MVPGRPGSGASSPWSLTEIRQALQSLVDTFDPTCWSLADAEAQVVDFTVIERLGGVGKALAAHRVATVRDRSGDGPGSTARWLAEVTGGTQGEARSTLQLGAGLDDRPTLSGAARRGALSPARASRVLEAATADPASEEKLVDTAVHGSHGDHRNSCARAKATGRSREDDRARHRRQLGLRTLRHWEDDEGMCRIEAALTPEDGAELLTRLRAQAERFFTEARREGRRDPRPAYLADALVALVCGDRSPATGNPAAGSPATGSPATGSPATGSPPPAAPDPDPDAHPAAHPMSRPATRPAPVPRPAARPAARPAPVPRPATPPPPSTSRIGWSAGPGPGSSSDCRWRACAGAR